jgi:glycosyltransferase involved in cell wall biosynthesis
VLDLARFQLELGWTVTVASPPTESFIDELGEAWISHMRWDARRSPSRALLMEAVSLRRVIARVKPDVVHLHSAKAGLAGRLCPGRAPVVFQPHCWSFEAGYPHAARAWERWAARRARVVVCVSRAERERARGFLGQFVVVPCGVDIRRFAPPHRAVAEDSVRHCGGPLVVCVGRVCRQKGQDVLADAWPSVAAAVPEACLAIVGDGPDRARLEAKGLERVHWVGAQKDVAAWFAAADVVVVPSRWDGMSCALLEAMASGRSVVATDVDGVREALRCGGIVPSDDPRSLANAVVARLRDPELAASEGRGNRARAEALYDLRTQIARLSEIDADLTGDQLR